MTKIYNFNSQALRVLLIENQPYFVASDIGNILKLKNIHNTLAAFPNHTKRPHNLQTSNGLHQHTLITIEALNRILKQGHKITLSFRKWIQQTVLPSIYSITTTDQTAVQLMAQLASLLAKA